MADELFSLPDLRKRTQVAARLDPKFIQDLNVLMTAKRETEVSSIIKWAVAQQAEPIRAAWQEAADRRAKEPEDG